MKIIRNYILEEVFSNFISTLLILTLVLLAGNVFNKMIDLVINQGIDLLRIVQLFGYTLPFLLVFTIPMAALIAILLTFGRLSADHELVALKASGISLRRIVFPILWVSLVLSLFTLFLNDQIATRSHYRVRQLSSEIGMKAPAAILEEGVFIKSFKNIILFIHHIDGNFLEQVRIYQPQEDGPTRTIIADRGELIPIPERNIIKLKLMDGISDEPDANNPGRFYKLKFGTYFLPLDISRFKFRGPVEKKRKELTMNELIDQFNRLKAEGFIDPYTMTEVHKKIAMAFSVFVFVLISIPLAIRTKRGEKAIGFAIALILGAIYWTLLIGVTSLSKSGTLPPVFIIHVPNLLFLTIGTVLLVRLLRT